MSENGSPYRPLPFRLRDDLQITQQVYRGESFSVVGDSLAIEYYRLNEQEAALLNWLDGHRSLDEIKQLFDNEFCPHQISHKQIQTCILDFHSKSLLETGVSDRGRHLLTLGRKKKRKKRLDAAKNLLAVKWRGINPDRLFRFLTPKLGWFFNVWMLIVSCVLGVSALIWLGVHFDEFTARLPGMKAFFSARNWGLLAIVLVFMKVLHELGHGIMFTKLGGRCHELGVMFLVFVPTLYVNTSDSWRIKSKWHRAAIACAGVYVELFLASLATFAWWYSKPGPVQYVFLNVMFLGSLSAFLFNGNPLLKFDGYFALSDIIEIPNLQQRSGAYVRNLFLRFGLGIREGDDHLETTRTRAWLAGYAAASYLFRIFLAFSIAFLIVRFAKPYGLGDVARGLGILTIAFLLLGPAVSLAKFFWIPGNRQRIKTGHSKWLAAAVATLVLGCFFVPLPDSVVCDFVVEPNDAKTVYVRHEGSVAEVLVTPASYVTAGQPIIQMRNIDLELEAEELRGSLAKLQSEADILSLGIGQNSSNAAKLRDLRQQMTTRQRRLAELERIASEMILRAPRNGQIIPRWTGKSSSRSGDRLQTWDGWTIESENSDATFRRGEPICDIGEPNDLVAKLVVDQTDVQLIREGQNVSLLLHSRPGEIVSSTVNEISEAESSTVQMAVTRQFGGTVNSTTASPLADDEATDHDDTASKPDSAIYHANVLLPSDGFRVERGIRGRAKVEIDSTTVVQRLSRFLNRTFRIDL